MLTCPYMPTCVCAPACSHLCPLPRPASHPPGAPNMPSGRATAQLSFHPPASPPHLLIPRASPHQLTIMGVFRGSPSRTAPGADKPAEPSLSAQLPSGQGAQTGLPAAPRVPLLQPVGRLRPHPTAVPAPSQGAPLHSPAPSLTLSPPLSSRGGALGWLGHWGWLGWCPPCWGHAVVGPSGGGQPESLMHAGG